MKVLRLACEWLFHLHPQPAPIFLDEPEPPEIGSLPPAVESAIVERVAAELRCQDADADAMEILLRITRTTATQFGCNNRRSSLSEMAKIQRYYDGMPELARSYFAYAYNCDWSYREIAEIYQVDKKEVERVLVRAYSELRILLDPSLVLED